MCTRNRGWFVNTGLPNTCWDYPRSCDPLHPDAQGSLNERSWKISSGWLPRQKHSGQLPGLIAERKKTRMQ